MFRLLQMAAVVGLAIVAASCTITGPVEDAVAVSIGANAGCLINEADGVECWGGLGGGAAPVVTYGDTATPVAGLPGPAEEISVGENHVCANLRFSVYCWGSNASGQLGSASLTDSMDPVEVQGLPPALVLQVVAGYTHTCALVESGSVYCWGNNFAGQIGDGTQATRLLATSSGIDGGTQQAVALAAGFDFSCALLSDGSVWCWGNGGDGQLGNGAQGGFSTSPVEVPGVVEARKLDAGRIHACANTKELGVFCWGSNNQNQINSGATDPQVPQAVSTPSSVKSLAVNGNRTCFGTDDGEAWCVGDGNWGSLGDGGSGSSNTLVLVTGTDTDPVAMIAAGHTTNCALGPDGDVRCWGYNGGGQLGAGLVGTISSNVPVPVIR